MASVCLAIRRTAIRACLVPTIGSETCATLFAELSLVSLEGLRQPDLSVVSFLQPALSAQPLLLPVSQRVAMLCSELGCLELYAASIDPVIRYGHDIAEQGPG